MVYLFGIDRVWGYRTSHLFRQFGADAPISRDRPFIPLEGYLSDPLIDLVTSLWGSACTMDVQAQIGAVQLVVPEIEDADDDDIEDIPEDFIELDDFADDSDVSSDLGAVDDGPHIDLDDPHWKHDEDLEEG